MTTDQLNNTSVEELALKAEDAIRDGVKTGDSVSLGDGMSGTIEVLDAGHSWVWDIRNGDRSKVNNNMLRTQLDKRDPDTNLRVFTTNPNHPGMPIHQARSRTTHSADTRTNGDRSRKPKHEFATSVTSAFRNSSLNDCLLKHSLNRLQFPLLHP
jgi:hypothetical protein